MKAVGDRMVIERKITQKKREIIVPGEPEFNSTVVDTIIHMGDKCPEDTPLKIGDKVVVNIHARPEGMELRTPEEDKNLRIFHGIIHYDDVAGIYEPEDKAASKKSGAIINEA